MKVTAGGPHLQTSLGGTGWPRPTALRRHPMAILLFGKRRPKRADRRKYPHLRKALSVLDQMKDEIAELVGRQGQDFAIELAEGANASIGRDGRISVGVKLLEQHGEDHDLLLAVLGHEIGHQPWNWPTQLGPMTKKQLDALYRDEERKADAFAGTVLAKLGGDPNAICEFLHKLGRFEAKPPADYDPATERAALIRQTFQSVRRRTSAQYRPIR